MKLKKFIALSLAMAATGALANAETLSTEIEASEPTEVAVKGRPTSAASSIRKWLSTARAERSGVT